MRRSILAVCIVVLLGTVNPALAVGIPAGTRLEIVADATYVNNQLEQQASPPAVVELTVLQVANVTIERGALSGQIRPGSIVYLPVRIHNVGNGHDSFGLSVRTARGWSVSLVGDDNRDGAHQSTEEFPVTNTGPMTADGYCPCFAKVMVPANANQNDAVILRAVSSADPARGTAQTQLPLDIPGSLSVSITSPTAASVYAASGDAITIQGMATGSSAVTSVTWKSDRGGSGTCTGTATWTASAVRLYPGANVLTVTAKDSTGLTATDTLTVSVATVTAPSITISSPSDGPIYSTDSMTTSIAGTASDAKGILSVTWSNDRGGSGTCIGTNTWGARDICLSPGRNVITVTACNTAGNRSSAAIGINYSPVTCPPAVLITCPTADPTYSTQDERISLSGTASSDATVSSVIWSSDRGGSGVCSGAGVWSVSGVYLRTGQNVITITARDSEEHVFHDSLTVTRTDPPVATMAITIPTTADTYKTGHSSVRIAGIAPENAAISEVRWSNNRGGSGICVGTHSWTAERVDLMADENLITITAYSGGAVVSSDALRVTYRPDIAPPVVQVTSPTTRSHFARNCSWVRLAGSVTDDTTVLEVNWENDTTGECGDCILDGESWTADGISLAQGDNLITLTAEDGVGNIAVRGLTIAYVDAGPGDAWLGRAMVSLPIVPDESDPKPAVGFDGVGWSCFQARTNTYAVYPSRATWFDPAESTPGRGFWGYFDRIQAVPSGTIPMQDNPVTIHLYPGWNMIGQPFISELAWDVDKIMVQEQGKAPRPLWMSSYLTPGCAWGWRQDPGDPSSGSYYMVYDSRLAPGVDDRLLPWMAYWVEATRECDLILPPPEGMR